MSHAGPGRGYGNKYAVRTTSLIGPPFLSFYATPGAAPAGSSREAEMAEGEKEQVDDRHLSLIGRVCKKRAELRHEQRPRVGHGR